MKKLAFALCAVCAIALAACSSASGSDTESAAQLLASSIDSAAVTGTSGHIFVYAAGDSASSITGNFTLPVLVGTDTAVVWSEKTDTGNHVSVDINTGGVTVTRGASDTTVVLTATVTVSSDTATKDFSFTVKKTADGIIAGIAVFRNTQSSNAESAFAGYTINACIGNDAVASAVTNSAGAYSMQIAPGSYYIEFDASGKSYIDDTLTTSSAGIVNQRGNTIFGVQNAVSVSSGATTTVNFTIYGY